MGDDPRSHGTPRWVKVFGIVAGIVVLLVLIVLLIGGEHGPGRHLPPDNAIIPSLAMALEPLRPWS